MVEVGDVGVVLPGAPGDKQRLRSRRESRGDGHHRPLGMLGVAGVERWRILDRRMGLGHAEHEEEGSIVGPSLKPIHSLLHI